MSAGGARPTVVVTGAAGPAGRALGRQLADRDLPAIGIDLAPSPVPGFESVEAAPSAAGPGYEPGTLDVLARLSPTVVLPTVEEELPRISLLALASDLAHRVVVSAPGPAALAGDKLLTMWALARHGVAVPFHAALDGTRSAQELLARAGGRLVLKPRVSRGGRDVHVVTRADDPAWDVAGPSWIAQAFVPGTEFAAQVYRSPVGGRGAVVVLRKTALEDGDVGNALSVERAGKRQEADVAALAARAVEALDLVGPADLDIRRTTEGTPVVLEINARFGALSAHAPELLDGVLDDWAPGLR